MSVREEQQPVDSHEDLVRRDEISMTDPTVGGRAVAIIRSHPGGAVSAAEILLIYVFAEAVAWIVRR